MTYFQYELRVPLAEFDRMAAQQILGRIKVMRNEMPFPKNGKRVFYEVESRHEVGEKIPARELDLFLLQGNLVMLPLDFLSEENLQPPTLAKEGIVPTVTWT